jgi:2-keto-4-pentenoate hydratase/2-oxohepta-3-ene-1,7-dioic acid hydratase in catechol pathway
MPRFYRIQHDGAPRHVVEDDGTWRVVEGDVFGSWRAGAEVPSAGHRLLPPVMPSKIVAVGLNYKDHAAEVKKALPAEPLLWSGHRHARLARA